MKIKSEKWKEGKIVKGSFKNRNVYPSIVDGVLDFIVMFPWS